MKQVVNINEVQLKSILVKALSESSVVEKQGKYSEKDLERIAEGVIASIKEGNIDEGFLKNLGRAALIAGGVTLGAAGLQSCTNGDAYREPDMKEVFNSKYDYTGLGDTEGYVVDVWPTHDGEGYVVYVTMKDGSEIKLHVTNEQKDADGIEKGTVIDTANYYIIYSWEEYYALFDDWDYLKEEGKGRIYDKWVQDSKYMIQIIYKGDNPNGKPDVRDFELSKQEWDGLKRGDVVPINYTGEVRNNPTSSYTKFYNQFTDWGELSEYDGRIYDKWISSSHEYYFTIILNRASKNATYSVINYKVDRETYDAYKEGDLFTID